jgi:hypothetical protein
LCPGKKIREARREKRICLPRKNCKLCDPRKVNHVSIVRSVASFNVEDEIPTLQRHEKNLNKQGYAVCGSGKMGLNAIVNRSVKLLQRRNALCIMAVNYSRQAQFYIDITRNYEVSWRHNMDAPFSYHGSKLCRPAP